MVNGAAIRFDRDGQMLDGQHRLPAILETGVTVESLVVYGLETESQHTMDEGSARRASHALTIHGYKNATTLAAALKLLYFHKRYGLARSKDSALLPDNREIVDLADQHPRLQDSVKRCTVEAFTGFVRYAQISFAHYVFRQIDTEAADNFVHKLKEGVGLKSDTGLLRLRQRFQKEAHLPRNRRTLDRRQQPAMIVKAWVKDRARW